MAKQVSNNLALHRYLLIVDITPNIGPVPGFTAMVWRNRTINLTTFKVVDRIAGFLNHLGKQMKKLQRESSIRTTFRWNTVLIDRLTGMVLDGTAIGNFRVQSPISTDTPPMVTNQPVVVIGTPEAREVQKLQRMYAALLDKSRLQPTLVMNEDPLLLLRMNQIIYGLGAGGEPAPAIVDNVLDTNVTSWGQFPEKFVIPDNYPKQYLPNFAMSLYFNLSAAFKTVCTQMQAQVDEGLKQEEFPTEQSLRQAEITRLRIARIIILDNDLLRISAVQYLLDNGIDPANVDGVTGAVWHVAQQYRPLMNLETATPLVTPLYISRDLLNGEEVVAWASSQGFPFVFNPKDMHTTQLYSKAPVDWTTIEPDRMGLTIPAGARRIKMLGDSGALAINFESKALEHRATELLALGGTSDFVGFLSHTTFTYKGKDMDLGKVQPYMGKLVFGPEILKEIKDEFSPDSLVEIDLTN